MSASTLWPLANLSISSRVSPFSSSTTYESAFLFNEEAFMIELALHALFNDMDDQDQILRYSWNMQDVLDVGFFSFALEWDISDMLNGVNCVIPNFNIVGSIGLSQFLEPIFVRCHVIRCSRVDKSYIV